MNNLQVDSFSFPRRPSRDDDAALQSAAADDVSDEIAFLAAYGVHPQVLRYASALARVQGVSADAALIAEGLISEDAFYRALAAHFGVAFLEDATLVLPQPSSNQRRTFAPLVRNARGLRWAVAPRGAAIAQLKEAVRGAEGPPLFGVISPSRMLAALDATAPQQRAYDAAHCSEEAEPAISARRASSRGVLAAAVAGNLCLFACLFAPFDAVSLGAAYFYGAAFLSAVFLRLFACAASYEAPENAPPLAESRLPHFSIVIPLYDEAIVVPQLAQAINRLDYPRAKLDIVFVLEADDADTAQALRNHGPRTPHKVVVAPVGQPRTKPRALNVAAPCLAGDFVAVYDAEDIPDADQLKKAAAAFAHAPQHVACVQASLVIGNRDANWITRLYALDYAALFDVFNKGVAALDLPIFLGGTSNHFRIEALRRVGFWDAFNVTEDADLGLRLARRGYSIRTIASATEEEAPSELHALLRQRTRWMKGWMQTALAHCCNPLRLAADLGARRTLAAFAIFSGSLAGPLLAPLFAILFLSSAVCGNLFDPRAPLEVVRSTSWCFLALSGCGAILWPLTVAMRRRGLRAYWPAIPLLPLWMLMLSAAAWRALYQLWRRPHHWEKTEHGAALRSRQGDEAIAFSGEEPLFE